jgi:DNA-binding response OmpR family regulator
MGRPKQRRDAEALSAKQKEVDIVRGFNLGVDDFITKPFSLVELKIRIQRMLK